MDHLENNLGLQIIPEDRLGIERQLAKKLRDPAVGSLLDQAEEQGLSLVMVPRIQRAILDGKLLKITSANLLRMYPQFFEDVQQVALKMRAEAYFLQETPQMGWGLTTAEIPTASHNTNYIQQKQVLKQHAQSHKSNEMRVRRRTLIEALFDLLAVKVVTGEKLLNNTADLTESKVGRANMAVINYGESGIRINDINRQQAHPQLGVCQLSRCLPTTPSSTQCIQSPSKRRKVGVVLQIDFLPWKGHPTPSSEKSLPSLQALRTRSLIPSTMRCPPACVWQTSLGQRADRR